MGYFSWRCSDTGRGVKCVDSEHGPRQAYLLIPEEFGGGSYFEESYDGYGHFAGHDVYELVAEWNKKYVTTDAIKKPAQERFPDAQDFARAVRRYAMSCCRLCDFKSGKSEDYMRITYGDNWKREIGIDLGCYDDQNRNLMYPIKITEHPMDYRDASPSDADEDQGL